MRKHNYRRDQRWRRTIDSNEHAGSERISRSIVTGRAALTSPRTHSRTVDRMMRVADREWLRNFQEFRKAAHSDAGNE